MAHFAKLNDDNVVTQVITVANEQIVDSNGNEQEQIGIDFCISLFGGTWKQTSFNNNIRKNYAGIGFAYDESRDAFIAPKPYNSWVLNESTCRWSAPVDMPEDDKKYLWDEERLSWVVLELT
jgi:hypothetical protein